MGERGAILLAGSHASLMRSLADRLVREADLELIGIAWTPADVLRAAAGRTIDVLVLDLDIAGRDGLRCAEAVRRISPRCHFLCFGALAEDQLIEAVLALGSASFVLKSELAEKVVPAIREALAGGTTFPEHVGARIIVDSQGPKLAKAV